MTPHLRQLLHAFLVQALVHRAPLRPSPFAPVLFTTCLLKVVLNLCSTDFVTSCNGQVGHCSTAIPCNKSSMT